MTLIDPLIQYMVLIGITIMFSGIALSRDTITFHLLTGLLWFISAIAHFALGEPTSLLTASLAYAYMGIGFIFAIVTIDRTLKYLRQKRMSLEVEF